MGLQEAASVTFQRRSVCVNRGGLDMKWASGCMVFLLALLIVASGCKSNKGVLPVAPQPVTAAQEEAYEEPIMAVPEPSEPVPEPAVTAPAPATPATTVKKKTTQPDTGGAAALKPSQW